MWTDMHKNILCTALSPVMLVWGFVGLCGPASKLRWNRAFAHLQSPNYLAAWLLDLATTLRRGMHFYFEKAAHFLGHPLLMG